MTKMGKKRKDEEERKNEKKKRSSPDRIVDGIAAVTLFLIEFPSLGKFQGKKRKIKWEKRKKNK